MLRKIVIGLAALAAVTAAPSVGALARGGMGHGGIAGGMPHGAMTGAISHASVAPSVGFVGAPRTFSASHPVAFTGNHIAFGHHFAFRHHHHHFFRNRFIFAAGLAYPYYDDGCWVRVWTRWGWRWRSLCY